MNQSERRTYLIENLLKEQGGYAKMQIPSEVFYLENPHGVIADFSGNPPYEF